MLRRVQRWIGEHRFLHGMHIESAQSREEEQPQAETSVDPSGLRDHGGALLPSEALHGIVRSYLH